MLAAGIAVGRDVCAGGLLGRRCDIRWSDRGNVYGFAPLLDVGDSLLDGRKAGIAESINAIIQDIQVEIRLRRIDGAEFHFLRRLDLAPARLKNEVRLRERQLDLAGREKLGGMATHGLGIDFPIAVPADELVDGVGGDGVGTPVEVRKNLLREAVFDWAAGGHDLVQHRAVRDIEGLVGIDVADGNPVR